MRIVKALIGLTLGWTVNCAAYSQTAPSPADVGVVKGTTDTYKLKDSSDTWVPFGTSTSHVFTPVGGGGGGGGAITVGSTPIVGGVDGNCVFDNTGVVGTIPCGSGGGTYVLPTASTSILGGVKVDGSTIHISGAGVISSSGTGTSAIAIGSTPVSGGVSGNCIYNNSGIAGTIPCGTGTGGGVQGVVYATDPAIGMIASTPGSVFDNGPLSAAMNTANAGGTGVTFPGEAGGQSTVYYFSKTLHWTSRGTLRCQTTDFLAPTTLVFAPGKDGVAFDNGVVSPTGNQGDGTFEGCRLQSLGSGYATSSNGANFFHQTSMASIGPIPATVWENGDGIVAVGTGNGYVRPHYPNIGAITHGAYVQTVTPSAVNGLTLTLASGFASDFDTDPTRTLYNLHYTANATSSWSIGATTIPVTDCTPFGAGFTTSEVHDAQSSPTKFVGLVANCTSNVVTLVAPAAVASVGSNDALNGAMYEQIIRLPVELAYNTTTQGPINITAASAFTTSSTTITVPSGACTGVITANQLLAASAIPVGYNFGADVFDYTPDPTNPTYLGNVLSCSGTTLTMNGTIAAASSGASDALTLVSRVMMITGGDGTPMGESDYIWSDAFEFGNMVSVDNYGSPASGGTETMIIHGIDDYPHAYGGGGWPASAPWAGLSPTVKPCPPSTPVSCIVGSVTHTAGSGKAWKLPAGFHKRVSSDSRNIHPSGFFIGYEDVGNGAQGAAGRDWGDYIEGNMIGRVNGGDDIAPNNEYAAVYGGNNIFDMLSMETVTGTSWGSNTNSGESGGAFQSIAGCSHNFLGMYSSDFVWFTPMQKSACLDGSGSLSVPPMPGYKTILNGGAGHADWISGHGPAQFLPQTGGVLDQSFMTTTGISQAAPYSFTNYNMNVLTVTATSPVRQSIVSGIPTNEWVFPGLQVRDLTTPTAIPDSTTVTEVRNDNTIVLSANLALAIPTGDSLQFLNALGGPCLSISPGFINSWGITADLDCQGAGATLYYEPVSQLWGWSSAKSGFPPSVGFPGFYYPGLHSGNGIVFPHGMLLGGASTGGFGNERPITEDYQLPSNYHTSGMTALQTFSQGINQKLFVSDCSYPMDQGGTAILDTTLSGNPVIGFTQQNSDCLPTPTLVLTLASTQASAANMDILTAGATTITAGDFFGTGNKAIPISTCTGVTAGATVKDTSLAGSPTMGTVSACNTQNVVVLSTRVLQNPAGATDALLGSSTVPGQMVLNALPTSTVGWLGKYASTPDTAIYFNPFGQISGDVNGVTWPTGTASSIAGLPVCDATHNAGMNAMVNNGIAAPTYLQTVSTLGSSNRRVFCDGTATGWRYD